MMKRVLSLCLAGVVAFSLTTPALAVRSGGNGGSPKAAAGTTIAAKPVTYSSTLSFSDIGSRVKANNLTLKAAQEGLKSAQAMNWDSAISDLEDTIDDLEDTMALLTSSASTQMTTASTALSKAIATALSSVNALADESLAAEVTTSLTTSLTTTIINASAAAAFSTYASMQQDSLQSTIDSLDEQLNDLKKQKKDYTKTLEDTEHQIDYAADQTISGAESLYLTILSTNLQLESLKDTLASTARTVSELETRYRLGQISKLTLTQVQNGYNTLSNSVDGLENTISTLKASLQSLMGETPTGILTLLDTPTVTDKELSAISYTKDLAKAKEQSYTLYSAARSVESAEDSLEDARKDNGKNSYQYKMAEYSYQSAVYQQQAAVASFETSFQSLYKAIAPAQASLAAAQTDLEYEEQVYAVAQVKYKQGNLSANALLDAQDTLESAKRDVTSAQLDLYTAYHNYRQAVEQGLVGS